MVQHFLTYWIQALFVLATSMNSEPKMWPLLTSFPKYGNFAKFIIKKIKIPPLCTVSHVIFLGGCGAKIRPIIV
jgi:hypothetical protein